MWIHTVLGESYIHIMLGLGLTLVIMGFTLGFIPFINKYKIPAQIIGIIVTAFAIYLEGSLANEKEWLLKVKEVEAQVAQAEAESAKLNTQLQAALADKGKVIREKGDTIIKYVDRFKDREVLKTVEGPERVRVEEVIKYIENCPVPKELLDVHNDAATMNKNKGEKK